MKVLSSTSLSFIQVSSPNFRDTMLHNFFQRCWLLQYFQSKKTSLFWMISPPVCELENFQVQNYTLSSERESHKHTNNTHVTYSVHLRGSYATETIYWWKNLTRVWGNLLERPLTLLPSTSSEQFKNLRVARHKVHIYIVWSKKLAVSCVPRLALGHALSRKNKSNTQ